METVKDRLWLFGVRAHQDDIWFAKGNAMWPCSRITPAEGAFMLDIPNVILVNCDGEPVPFSANAFGYAESFCRMQNVLWGATGSNGFRVGNEEAFICELAQKYPNIRGAFLDDFLGKYRGQPDAEEKTEQLLQQIRAGLEKACRPMELATVLYTHELDEAQERFMQYMDSITLWTWKARELPLLEERFCAIEKRFPKQKKLLGIYMFEFDTGNPISNELMEHQCELGLRLLREDRISGMIFEANSVMGIGLPSELWLRDWIDRVKNLSLSC